MGAEMLWDGLVFSIAPYRLEYFQYSRNRPVSVYEEAVLKRFADLSEQEILALAITNEEEDSRIYRGFSEGLRAQFPSSAKVFDEMADEEVRRPALPSPGVAPDAHRRMLVALTARDPARTLVP